MECEHNIYLHSRLVNIKIFKAMIRLNLPEYSFRIRATDNRLQVFDVIRKKFVALTPEEWVRQNFIQYLIQEKKYPASLFSIERETKYNRLKKRSDIRIFDRHGNLWMIVECKNPKVTINQKIFNQITIYNMSHKVKTKFLAVTNGLKHYCCSMKHEEGKYVFLEKFPDFV